MGVRKWLIICIIAIVVGVLVNYLYEEEIIHDNFRMTTEAKEVQVEGASREEVQIESTLEEEGQEHKHVFVKTVWEEATCEKSGYYTNVCKECGREENVQEPPISHETEDVVIQEGNCMEDTIIHQMCKHCKQQIGEEIRYTESDKHDLMEENIDGAVMICCARCGVVL